MLLKGSVHKSLLHYAACEIQCRGGNIVCANLFGLADRLHAFTLHKKPARLPGSHRLMSIHVAVSVVTNVWLQSKSKAGCLYLLRLPVPLD